MSRSKLVTADLQPEACRLPGNTHATLLALRRSEQRFANALEHAPIGMAIVSPEGRFNLVNQALCQLVGYSKAELERLTFQHITHPDDLKADLDLVQKLVANEIPSYQLRKRYLRKDGAAVSILLTVSLMRDEAGTPLNFIAQIQDITEQLRREAYIRHIAQHDALTHLPNRILFHDRATVAIENCRRSGHHIALLMVDLDHFKRINDSLGHDIGDELLKIVAGRILACVRSGDTVARMGGDEFVVLLNDLKGVEAAQRIASDIVSMVSASMAVVGHELVVSPSVGIAMYPIDGQDVQTLIKNADTAMYKAKNAGRAGYKIFNREMADAAAQQLSIEAAIRHGLKHEEFRLHYQPQVCIRTGQIIGVEALIRWQHGAHAIPPSTFIPVAEQTGLMQPLGEWVLHTALAEARSLYDRTGMKLKLAVNLSPIQIQSPHFKDKLARMLRQTQFDPHLLEIEITEGLLISDLDQVHETLREIRELGVSVALDDFGTGYSSLSYLARFPINTLKIDRSFMLKLLDNSNDRAVVQAILAMAQSLELRVIAEGVETPEQLRFLQKRHRETIALDKSDAPHIDDRFCVQGFHFSQALALEQLIETLDELKTLSKGRVQASPALRV